MIISNTSAVNTGSKKGIVSLLSNEFVRKNKTSTIYWLSTSYFGFDIVKGHEWKDGRK